MNIDSDKPICVALRRTIMQNIPHYCFTDIIINKNETLLDNDHIKKRIMNIPVEKIYINIKKLKSLDKDLIVNNDINYNVEDNKIDILKIECDKKYDIKHKDLLQSISTDDFKYFLNDNEIKNPYKHSIKILDLKYDTDMLKFTALTTLNIPVKSINYSVSETPILIPFKKIHKLSIFPINDTISKEVIIENAIFILNMKLDYLLETLNDNNENKGIIVINNDLFTLGNLISYYLNEHKDIKFSSVSIETLIKKSSNINYIIDESSKTNIKTVMKSIVTNIKNQLNNIKI